MDIFCRDDFMCMPAAAQALYFHLKARSNAHGYVRNPLEIRQRIGATESNMRMLIDAGFVEPFAGGIVVHAKAGVW